MSPDGTCADCVELEVAVLDESPHVSVVIDGLDPAVTYTFAVVAVNEDGERSQLSPAVMKKPGP